MSDVAIGIDVGGTKALALLVARDGRVLGEVNAPTPHDDQLAAGEATTRVLADQVQTLCRSLRLDPADIPIGLGLPGMMRRDGRLAYAPNLQSASGAELGVQLSSLLGSSLVVVDNDANCAALAEHEWGAARGVRDFVMVTLGTGIGGGVFVDDRLVRGQSGFAGEIGHMVVVADGAPCPCGGRGCWERYASGGGLQRLVGQAAREGRLEELVRARGGAENLRPEDLTESARRGSSGAQALLCEMGWWLALGLSNLSAILDCGHFVIGGGLSSAADLFLPTTREALSQLVEGYRARPTITVATSLFGPRSGAMGATLVAFERLA